jgi:hypothetical protein
VKMSRNTSRQASFDSSKSLGGTRRRADTADKAACERVRDNDSFALWWLTGVAERGPVKVPVVWIWRERSDFAGAFSSSCSPFHPHPQCCPLPFSSSCSFSTAHPQTPADPVRISAFEFRILKGSVIHVKTAEAPPRRG